MVKYDDRLLWIQLIEDGVMLSTDIRKYERDLAAHNFITHSLAHMFARNYKIKKM